MATMSKPLPSEVQSGSKQRWRGSPLKHDAVFSSALSEMLILYFPPFRAEDDGELLAMAIVGIGAYVEDLVDFDEATIRRGWQEARRKHRRLNWPTPAELRDACQSVAPAKPAALTEKRAERTDGKPLDYFPHKHTADGFMATADGQWALAHGCAGPAWQFVAKGGRLPSSDELDDIAVAASQRERRLCEQSGVERIDDLSDMARGIAIGYLTTARDREARLAKRFGHRAAA